MVDWNDYALKPQMQSVQPQAQAPAPAPAPMPFGLGGLISALLNKGKPPATPPAIPIDQRPADMQSLVSMFNTPNPANTPAPAPAPAPAPHKPSLFDLFGGYRP